ncbi:class III poly(R)-hydroxyalkanoic acid synthase subunit PhaC, partial [Microcoleus sp. herbarium5]
LQSCLMVLWLLKNCPEYCNRATRELTEKLMKGVEIFTRLWEEDIQVRVTPKEEVYREDKILL